jgi:hypothetical protein
MEEEGLQLNQAEQYLFEVLLNETCKELDFFFFFLYLTVCCFIMILIFKIKLAFGTNAFYHWQIRHGFKPS